MDNKWLLSLVLLLIGFIVGYLASFNVWGAAPRQWMMRPYSDDDFSNELRPGWGMREMMGYPVNY